MNTIHLQSVGKMPAQPAGNIKAGAKIMWNFGSVYKILEVTKETEKMIFVKTQSVEGGEIYETKYLKNRLLAILPESLQLVASSETHDFYMGKMGADFAYNIVPKGAKVPTGYYPDKNYILKIKGQTDLFPETI